MIPVMTEAHARIVLEEAHRRLRAKAEKFGPSSSVIDELFDKQREFALDEHRSKTVMCDRRAGKTFGLTNDLLYTAGSAPEHDCLYLNPTAKQARLIMWDGPDGLKAADKRHNLGCHPNNQNMVFVLSNQSRIICGGAETREDIEYYRGFKFKKIVIDEAGAFKAHLEPLITDVLQPTLMDLRGTLIMAGTPGKILAGMFYEATRTDGKANPAWRPYRWTVFDNPHIDDPGAFHEWILKTNNWSREHPAFRREYLGEWVREESTLVYRYHSDGRNTYHELPDGPDYSHILSIDLGYEDPTAFRVISFSDDLRDVYLGEFFQKSHLSISEVAAIIKTWDEKYNFMRIVADTGGLGKQIVAEINERHLLDIHAAEKNKKADFIETLNADLTDGHVKIRPDDPIIPEWAALQWADEERRIEDPRFANHNSDATLYGWREAKHFTYVTPERTPKPGDADFWEHEAERMLELEKRLFEEKQGEHWWEQS